MKAVWNQGSSSPGSSVSSVTSSGAGHPLVTPLKIPRGQLPSAPGTPGTPGALPVPAPVPQTPISGPPPGSHAFETDLPQELLHQVMIYSTGSLLQHSPAGELEMQKKPLNGFQGCHEDALNESFKMSPHLIGLG